MGGRSRSERAASLRARQEMFDRMRRSREERLFRAAGRSLESDHGHVVFEWSRLSLVPVRFDSIEAVEEFLNG